MDPRFIDTKSRPSLAQTFEVNATQRRITVDVNHLKSKGSGCEDVGDPDTGDGQGSCNQTRAQAAKALVDWLATDPTGSGSTDTLVIGDLNAYTFEDPIKAFTGAGYANLVREHGGLAAYSYVFDGESGYLDHALATPSLASKVTGAADWHINADEPIALDYNTEFKTAGQVGSFYDPGPYRSSDHDPVVVGISLPAEIAPTTLTAAPAFKPLLGLSPMRFSAKLSPHGHRHGAGEPGGHVQRPREDGLQHDDEQHGHGELQRVDRRARVAARAELHRELRRIGEGPAELGDRRSALTPAKGRGARRRRSRPRAAWTGGATASAARCRTGARARRRRPRRRGGAGHVNAYDGGRATDRPSEMPTVKHGLSRCLLAEFLGSAFLAAIVIGSGIAAQQLSPADTGLALLENAAATAAGLFAIILIFGPVSGAHLNPVVSLVDAHFGGLSWRDAFAYIPAQIAGCVTGAIAANGMFALSAISISTHHRASAAHLFAEAVATLGLLLVIFSLARTGRGAIAPAAVGAYIGAAYWFTSSTSFANPAITIGRIFSDTFAGIAPASVPAFTLRSSPAARSPSGSSRCSTPTSRPRRIEAKTLSLGRGRPHFGSGLLDKLGHRCRLRHVDRMAPGGLLDG